MFLDEPTSGLDARSALICMRVVRKICNTGRCVIVTIHQPSSDLFFFFDRLLLLKSGGYEAYFGDIGEQGSKLVTFFEDSDPKHILRKPLTMNPASWMLDVIGGGIGNSSLRDYVSYYAESELRKENLKVLDELIAAPSAPIEKMIVGVSGFMEFYLVFKRLWISYWRNPAFNSSRLMILTFLGVLFGLVYLQINDHDYLGLRSKMSAIFMTCAFNGVIHSSSALPVLCRFRPVFYREKSARMYKPASYAWSLGLVEIPYIFAGSFLFLVSFYFMSGMIYDGTQFFRYLLGHAMVSLCFSSLGQFAASITPHAVAANILQGMLFTFSFLFGGVFISRASIPQGWVWVYYLDVVPKGVLALCSTQFASVDRLIQIPGASSGGGPVYMTTTDAMSMMLDFSVSDRTYGIMIGWLALSYLVMRVVIALVLTKVAWITR